MLHAPLKQKGMTMLKQTVRIPSSVATALRLKTMKVESGKLDKKYNPAEFAKTIKRAYDFELSAVKKADNFMRELDNELDVDKLAFKREGNAYFVYVKTKTPKDHDQLRTRFKKYADLVNDKGFAERHDLPGYNIAFRIRM